MVRGTRSSALRVSVLFLSARLTSCGTPLFSSSSAVIELTPSRFNATVLSSRVVWFVDYYADWCPHCIHFAPVWERVAEQLKTDARVSMGAMDCALHMDYCASQQIGAYPTLRVYNLPGNSASSLPRGADLHEGEIAADHEDKLLELVKEKLSVLGPASPTSASRPSGETPSPSPLPGATSAPAPAPTEVPASAASAELRLIDAEVALVYALHQGTSVAAVRFPADPPVSGDPLALSGEVLDELVRWLVFLTKVMPSSRVRESIGELAAVARAAQHGSGALPRSAWTVALQDRTIGVVPPSAGKHPEQHWRLCASYTCGLWTLFHIVMASASSATSQRRLADAANIAGMADVDLLGAEPTPGEALSRIRGFVGKFFGCEDCVAHFTAMYDSCGLGRCDLHPLDGQGSSLWLWRMHNNVTARVAQEHHRRAPGPWPRSEFCDPCWEEVSDGAASWNGDVVFSYLNEAYLPYDASREVSAGGLQRAMSSPVAIIILALLTVAAGVGCLVRWRRRRDKSLFFEWDGEDSILSPSMTEADTFETDE